MKVLRFLILCLFFTNGFSQRNFIQKIDSIITKNYQYDVVTYFDKNLALKGNKEINSTFENVKYNFSSEENKNKFEKSKQEFVPEYGGLCAFSISRGFYTKGNPEIFTIIDNKLYFFCNERALQNWTENYSNRILTGDKKWLDYLNSKNSNLLSIK